MKYVLAAAILLLAACGKDSSYQGTNPKEAARINTQLGVDYLRKDNLELALEKLERAVDQDEDNAQAYAWLGFVQNKRGETKKADKAYRSALNIASVDSNVRNMYGIFLCSQNRPGEAEKYFIEAAADKKYLTPEAAWANAGECFLKRDAQKAERFFRAALDANKEYPAALARMALLTHQGKDFFRARAFLQRYELVAPVSAESLWLGVQNERALDDADAAARFEQRLKAEFPESEEAAALQKTEALKNRSP